jgi:site-specific recombinase XerC
MADAALPAPITPAERLLTAAEFQRLADVPPEVEWFRNLKNASTERAYRNAIRDFMRFTGIARPEEFRIVTRAHVIEWRKDLERREIGRATENRNPAGATIRHRLAALSSLFEYLCEKNAVTHNPVKGVKWPRAESGEGKTPAIGDHQARELLAAPDEETVKEKRDRAILSTLLYHALRWEELCKLRVKDFKHARRGVPHLNVSGKGEKTRYLPLHPGTNELIHDYLEAAGHGDDENRVVPPATTAPAGSTRRSRPTGSTGWCGGIQRRSVSRSAPTRCARRPPPTRSTTRPTSPRCRNGSATPTSPPPASTITARRVRRTVRRSRWRISDRSTRLSGLSCRERGATVGLVGRNVVLHR